MAEPWWKMFEESQAEDRDMQRLFDRTLTHLKGALIEIRDAHTAESQPSWDWVWERCDSAINGRWDDADSRRRVAEQRPRRPTVDDEEF